MKVYVGDVKVYVVCGDNPDEETGELNIIKATANKIVKHALVLIFLAISLISV